MKTCPGFNEPNRSQSDAIPIPSYVKPGHMSCWECCVCQQVTDHKGVLPAAVTLEKHQPEVC